MKKSNESNKNVQVERLGNKYRNKNNQEKNRRRERLDRSKVWAEKKKGLHW